MNKPLNWQAIHQAYREHKGRLGQAAVSPAPQPDTHKAGYGMLIHAMSKTDAKPGEDHSSMIIRALSEHLKRISPDVGSIHKDAMKTE